MIFPNVDKIKKTFLDEIKIDVSIWCSVGYAVKLQTNKSTGYSYNIESLESRPISAVPKSEKNIGGGVSSSYVNSYRVY